MNKVIRSKKTRGLLGNVGAQASGRPCSPGATDRFESVLSLRIERKRWIGFKPRAAVFLSEC